MFISSQQSFSHLGRGKSFPSTLGLTGTLFSDKTYSRPNYRLIAGEKNCFRLVCLLSILFLLPLRLCASVPDTVNMTTAYSTITLNCGDEYVIYDNGGAMGNYFGSGTKYITINLDNSLPPTTEIHFSVTGETSESDYLTLYNTTSANPVTLTTTNRMWYYSGPIEWRGALTTGGATLKFNVANQSSHGAGFEVRVWVCCNNNDISAISSSAITTSGASLNWSDASGATQWIVCYGSDSLSLNDTLRVNGTTATLTGLYDNTPYYYTIYNNTTTPVESGLCRPNSNTFTTLPNNVIPVGCADYRAIHSLVAVPSYGNFSNPTLHSGAVDFGASSMHSRHTVHRDTAERDPRTGYLLRTVPEGSDASVRLGNWCYGNEAEQISYKMVVDTTMSDLLLLKYAAVLQNPSHTNANQPRLMYSITKLDGTPIGVDGCYDVEFAANGALGWNNAPDNVIWKDWTSVGMSLSGLHGDTILITLTTKDCNENPSTDGGMHYGYAYFTLECGTMNIHYSGCSATIGDSVSAPEGFSYEWFNVASPSAILDTNRVFVIPSAGSYACRMQFVGAPGATCQFVLNVSSEGQHPVADFDYVASSQDGCATTVYFNNRSAVYSGSGILPDVNCSGYLWLMPDGTTTTAANPTFSFDSAGVYPVTLIAMLDGDCDDTLTKNVTITCPCPLPDNIDSAECSFEPIPSSWGIMVDDQIGASDHVCTLITPFVGDVDGDGIVEMVCFSTDGGSNVGNATGKVNKVLVYDGVSHARKYMFTLSQYVSAFDASPFGLVRLQNGTGLIVFACLDNKLHAYTANGTAMWTSNATFGSGRAYSTNVGFADFNNDGYPEVYVRDKIFDAETGVLLADASASNQGSAYAHTYTSSSPWKLGSSFATNIIGDQKLELLLGNQIYSVDITNRTGTSGNSITLAATAPATTPASVPADGHAQVADFNLDGHLDVFISSRKNGSASSNVYGYVWDVHHNSVSTAFDIPTTHTGKSIPLIADIDNDDSLEVVIHCGVSNANLRAYKYHASSQTFSLFWTKGVAEDSYSNCMTLFDFNLDGNSELLICDENKISIVNGSTQGTTTDLSTLSFKEVTIMQYPIIADVDGDGAAEIVFVGNATSKAVTGTLNVCRSNGTPWAPARPVWNQYMYDITNVNKDLSIPQRLFNNATAFTDPDSGVVRRPYNNFFQQATITDQYGRPFYVAPDLTVTCDRDSILYTDTNVTVPIRYCNHSQATFGSSTVYVTIYKVYQGVRTYLATLSNPPSHPFGQIPGSCTTHRIAIGKSYLCPLQPLDSLVFEVNSQGNGIAQNGGLTAECDTTNNTITIDYIAFPDERDTLYASVCQGSAYSGQGVVIPADSTAIPGLYQYIDTVDSSSGCSAINTLYLTVNPAPITDTLATVCDSIVWHGTRHYATGIYADTLQTPLGCDSIVRLNLTVSQSSTGDTNAEACNRFEWYGSYYTASTDTPTHHFTNEAGCDSSVTLHLTIYQDQHTDTVASACNSFVWYGNRYTTTGTYNRSLTSVHGCDSTVTLHLTIFHDASTTISRQGCDTVIYNGYTYLRDTLITKHYTTAQGCDSSVSVDIKVYPQYLLDVYDSVPEGWIYEAPGGYRFDQPGVYPLPYTTANGCDSLVYLHLSFVKQCEILLQFPNLVTPNGDGVNEMFEIKNLIEEGCYPINLLTIYNRWGTAVYSVHNISKKSDFWDPNNPQVPSGTYYFIFHGNGIHGRVERHGVIEVMR